MDLVLWRHAKAEELSVLADSSGEPMRDLDRPLTDKGWRDAKKVSGRIEKRLDSSFVIFSSPALRTIQTAQCLGRKIKVLDLLYQGSAKQIFSFLHWPELQSSTVIVGHQPSIGRLASLILTGEDFPLVVEPGAFFWFRWKTGYSGGQPALVWAMTPGCLKKNSRKNEKND
ncbi:SixA phosphatase family protein [Leptospirillum ferrooxidans]|jgi:phosphohistidine phosphatase|uniref:SixA phosphatase family protein n=1 Tax=Leptospirillum ferrooxidans TaxID=180 RepID=UPI0006822994|nr:histidine phosphatase family protein [Leptospirillum ferrooxidans]